MGTWGHRIWKGLQEEMTTMQKCQNHKLDRKARVSEAKKA